MNLGNTLWLRLDVSFGDRVASVALVVLVALVALGLLHCGVVMVDSLCCFYFLLFSCR
jgi:hypothetical protein